MCRVQKQLHPATPPSHRQDVVSLSLPYPYCHGKCSDEPHSLVSPILTFTARDIVVNHSHPPLCFMMRSKVPLEQLLPMNPLIYQTDSQEDVFPFIIILTCSSLGITIILTAFTHKLCLLLCSLLPWVASRPCTGWTSL